MGKTEAKLSAKTLLGIKPEAALGAGEGDGSTSSNSRNRGAVLFIHSAPEVQEYGDNGMNLLES